MGLSHVVDITAEIQGQSGQQFKTTSSEVMSEVMDNQMTAERQSDRASNRRLLEVSEDIKTV